ncbi:hypothetical protein [Streptomyces pactum]|uniref:DUF4232 domain-containing protein n=1 Tax=Streptomyces pactum TaxID=68249 RepID=A0A1S6J9M8_9ACTN|nr:hypothetical protein [Streptomyces pactum]AQS68443.1 hypothetical protein B1H29_17225 [Streptomyces pactum]
MSDGDDARRDARDERAPREGHAPTEPTGTAGLIGQEQPKHTHAGNGTVNHGPAEQGPDVRGPEAQGPDAQGSAEQGSHAQGPDGQGSEAHGPDAHGTGTRGTDGLGSEELALRRMLHQAVQDVEPSDGTLDHLRRAVPARRARKRQAVVGVAAAALFIGTAVPALVHVSGATGPGADPSVAGHASQAQGGASQGKDPAGGQSGIAGSAGTAEGKDKADPEKTPDKGRESGAATGTAPGTDPSASAAVDVPACTAKQLGPAVASSAAPDSTGVVYGSFRVTNVSPDGCTVTGPGNVVATPQGAADATKIGTARHAAGDAAAGLPDPSLETTTLTLVPSSAYEVRFAWVPSETCPTTGGTTEGGTGGPSPAPSPTEPATPAAGGASTGGGGGGDTAPTTQLVTEDGPADGSVAVTYTPEGGVGSATATVSDACAGTVYWTGVLAGTGM